VGGCEYNLVLGFYACELAWPTVSFRHTNPVPSWNVRRTFIRLYWTLVQCDAAAEGATPVFTGPAQNKKPGFAARAPERDAVHPRQEKNKNIGMSPA